MTKRIQCKICKKRLLGEKFLRRHYETKHKNEKIGKSVQ